MHSEPAILEADPRWQPELTAPNLGGMPRKAPLPRRLDDLNAIAQRIEKSVPAPRFRLGSGIVWRVGPPTFLARTRLICQLKLSHS